MKRVEPESVGEILRQAIEQQGMQQRFAQQQAVHLWPKIVGPGINRYTSRRYVQADILHVFITSAPLKQELFIHRQAILQAINQAIGSAAITDIHFH